jgi:hypothetical protein
MIAQYDLGGLAQTNMSNDNQSIEDDADNSISLQCQIALSHLSHIFKNDLFDMQFQHVEELLQSAGDVPEKAWLNIYVAFLSFNSTINGATSDKI